MRKIHEMARIKLATKRKKTRECSCRRCCFANIPRHNIPKEQSSGQNNLKEFPIPSKMPRPPHCQTFPRLLFFLNITNITVTMNCEFAKFSAYPQLEKFAKNLPSNAPGYCFHMHLDTAFTCTWILLSHAPGYCFHMHLDTAFTCTWILLSHALGCSFHMHLDAGITRACKEASKCT